MSEQFKLNNIALDDNLLDIQVSHLKNVEEQDFIRDNSTYAFQGVYSRDPYVASFVFDPTNSGDIATLTKVVTQIDTYPFVFVSSDRFDTYINDTVRSQANKKIFCIKSFKLGQDSTVANNIIYLSIEFQYFNYLPFAKDYSFIDTERQDPQINIPIPALIKRPESQKDSGPKVLDSTLDESKLFNTYFAKEYSERLESVNSLLARKECNSGFLGMRVPVFTEEPVDSVDMEKLSVTSIEDPQADESIYIHWEDIATSADEATDLNIDSRAVMKVELTKYNNVAVHNMIGWSYPVVQYIGNSGVSMSIVFKNKTEDPVDRKNHPSTLIKHAFSKMDVNYSNYKKYFPYNVMKVDSLITRLVDPFGFILAEDNIVSSSSFAGEDDFTIILKESDTRNILKRRQFNAVDNFSTDKDLVEEFLKVMLKLEKDLTYFKDEKKEIVKDRTADYLQRHDLARVKKANYDDQVMSKSGLSVDYLHLLEKKYNLPKDLLYSVMYQESRGNPNAYNSTSGATGAFQFLPGTAKDMGLVVNGTTDERRDPAKAAEAAAKYFVWMRDRRLKTNDVRLLLSGYNHGPGATNKKWTAAKKNGTDFLPSTPKETRDYVANITERMNGLSGRAIFVPEVSAPTISSDGETIKRELSRLKSAVSGVANVSINSIADIQNSRSSNQEGSTIRQRIDNLIKESGVLLIRYGETGNRFVQPYLHQLKKNRGLLTNVLLESFGGEAIEDLHLGERIINYQDFGFDDPSEIRPFFFIKSTPYINKDMIKTSFSTNTILTVEHETGKIEEISRETLEAEDEFYLKPAKLTLSKAVPNIEQEISPLNYIDTLFKRLDPKMESGIDFLNFGGDKKIEQDFYDNANGIQFGSADVDPFDENELIESHSGRMASNFDQGLDLAFPTIKVYLVVGDETSFGENFADVKHQYFEIKGLQSFDLVTNNDDNPVDVVYMRLSNPGSVYTDNHVLFDVHRPKFNFQASGTTNEIEIEIDQMQLTAGSRLHIKAGYGNDVDELDTIFNGIVTEVSGEQMIEVMAEGFGRELVAYEHGDDPSKDNFWFSATTAKILSYALYSKEIEHFGDLKFKETNSTASGNLNKLWSGTIGGIFKYWFSSSSFINIYINEITDIDGDFGLSVPNFLRVGKEMIYDFPIFKITPWQMLKEMEYRHPGTLSKPMIYSDRMSYFFGIKEQLYIYRRFNNDLDLAQTSTDEKLSSEEKGFARSLLMKPAVDFHILTSEQNIISNKLKLSSDFNTVVNVQYWDEQTDIKKNDYNYLEMKIDDNLRPMAHRRGEFAAAGINNTEMAIRYGSTYLRREAEKMYDGEITIIGNPKVKANDMALLDDSFRGLQGIVKVRECTHHFDIWNGYVTKITPGLYIEESHLDYSDFFAKAYLSTIALVNKMKYEALAGNRANQLFIETELLLDLLTNIPKDNSTRDKGYEDTSTAGKAVKFGQVGVEAALLGYLAFRVSGGLGKVGTGTSLTARATGKIMTSSLWSYSRLALQGVSTHAGALSASMGEWIYTGGKALSQKGIYKRTGVGSLVKLTGRLLKHAPKAAWLAGRVGSGFASAGSFALLTPAAAAAITVGLVTWIGVEHVNKYLRMRQPVRIYPLLQNNIPYIAGIYGYQTGDFFTDMLENLGRFVENENVQRAIDPVVTPAVDFIEGIGNYIKAHAVEYGPKSPIRDYKKINQRLSEKYGP